jgi:hypothetical protein
VSIRHAALLSGAVLVLGLGVYLWIEVHAQPVASASPEAVLQRTDDPVSAISDASAAPAAAQPGRTTALRGPAAAPAPVASSPVVAPAAPSGPPPTIAGAAAAAPDSEPLSGPRLDAAMAEANHAYDRGDLDEAKTLASRLLAQQPTNVRMLRIMVSASCIDGDTPAAQVNFAKLPAPDQAQMRIRCARYGVTFPDKP